MVTTDSQLTQLRGEIEPVRARLKTHGLYQSITSLSHVRIFLQSHVFAVWDFMSLLKALQQVLTCVQVPWLPSPYPESRRLINDIVLGEESDELDGTYRSHFEIYTAAMRQAGADCRPIDRFVEALRNHAQWDQALSVCGAPDEAALFVRHTFRVIESGKPHVMAAAFTFGREDLIPDLFRALIRDLRMGHSELDLYSRYLDRHIEVDSGSHGPLALRMVADLCGDDSTRWSEASTAATEALEARLALWDGIQRRISRSSSR
jgi:hypothetical protein